MATMLTSMAMPTTFRPTTSPIASRPSSSRNQFRTARPIVRCLAEGPLRRPSAPSAESASPAIATPPAAPSTGKAPSEVPAKPSASPLAAASGSNSGVTVEYQRQRAKEMQAYFRDKKYEQQVQDGKVFGWTRKNEISNGRWSMFGLSVGLLTEYATGVHFPDQLKIIVSNLGIADVDF